MTEQIRVCVISDGCTSLTVPAGEWTDHIAEIQDLPPMHHEDEQVYTLIFKSIKRSELDDLPEFDGF